MRKPTRGESGRLRDIRTDRDQVMRSLIDSGYSLDELYIDSADLDAGNFECLLHAIRWDGTNLERIRSLDPSAELTEAGLKVLIAVWILWEEDWDLQTEYLHVGDCVYAWLSLENGGWMREWGTEVMPAREMDEYVRLADLPETHAPGRIS